MKLTKKILSLAVLGLVAAGAVAQVESGSGVRRRSERDKKNNEAQSGAQITPRMQDFYEAKSPHDADLEFMRRIYRRIDLTKDANTPLYFPEDLIDGQENLFRLIMRVVTDGTVPAYEYLDGREIFTDQYKLNVPEMLDRFDIYYQQGGGKNGGITIEEADVPTGQVLNYYILEKWEFDRRSNQMKTRVEAICPVLNRMSDFGGDTRYPMFWVKFDALRPFLANQYIFLTDDNNLPTYSLDDYFNLGMYDGEIYKTQNLRNLSMNQMFPDEDDLKAAQDSIDRRLRDYGKHLWVPTREEYLAQKEREEAAKQMVGDDGEPVLNVVDEGAPVEQKRESTKKRTTTKKKRSTVKKSKPSGSSSSSGNSNAAKSVRRRKK